jgi:hypothetical protein
MTMAILYLVDRVWSKIENVSRGTPGVDFLIEVFHVKRGEWLVKKHG